MRWCRGPSCTGIPPRCIRSPTGGEPTGSGSTDTPRRRPKSPTKWRANTNGRRQARRSSMPAERPLIIGVVGGSGSGKTTVTRAIHDLPGVDAAFIDQDAYYRDLSHLPLEERKRVNYDHPEAFDTDLLVHQLSMLSEGHPVDKPTYDYAAH